MGAIASRITSLAIVYSIVYSDANQRKYQSSASLAFVRGIHRGSVNFPHKWPITRKCFHLMTSSWKCTQTTLFAGHDLIEKVLQRLQWMHFPSLKSISWTIFPNACVNYSTNPDTRNKQEVVRVSKELTIPWEACMKRFYEACWRQCDKQSHQAWAADWYGFGSVIKR